MKMSKAVCEIFVVLLVVTVVHSSLLGQRIPKGGGPTLNGSIFGKREGQDMGRWNAKKNRPLPASTTFNGYLPSPTNSNNEGDNKGNTEYRYPSCEYIYQSCNEWFALTQDSK